MTTKVVKGSLWTFAGHIAPLAVSLIVTPFTIRLLGTDGYGVLILIGLIPIYFGFADFGMSIASTKFASEAFAAGDTTKEAGIVRTAAFVALIASTPIAGCIFLLSPTLARLFNVPDRLAADASLAIKIASITFVITLLCGIFNTPQLTRLRMDLNTSVNASFRILGLIAMPIVLYLGFGLVGAVLVLFITAVMTLIGHLLMSRSLLSGLFHLSIENTVIRPMLKFGGPLVLASGAAMLVANLEKGILPGLVSVEALAYYSVAFTLTGMMTLFSQAMIQSLIPAFSQMQGSGKKGERDSLFARGLKVNLILLVPAVTFLAIIAETFFTVWAGKEFGDESVVPFYILLIGLMFNIPAFLPYAAIMSSGRTDIFAKLYIAELVPYMLLVFMLTYQFGAVGAATAWSIRVAVDAVALFILAKKTVGVDFSFGQFATVAIAVPIMAIPFSMHLYFAELVFTTALTFSICLVIYIFMIWKRALEKEEISWLSSIFLGR